MKRPQSAKPGHRGHWGQSSVEDINDPAPKVINRKQVKLIRPDMTVHDFARIMPRRIHQDKQRLYSEALQLKQNLNEVTEENVRLKTKISILEREKEKMNKFIDTAPEGLGAKGSRINAYGVKSYQKDNMMTRNLKKIVKELREDNEGLRMENQKIKKMMKYTKINELEIERKMITDENRRLSTMLEEYSSQFVDQEEIEKENDELKKYLEEELEEKNQISQEREKYEEIIQSLEEKLKSEGERYLAKEKRLLRDLNAEKRRVQELTRRNDGLLREYKSVRENQQYLEQRQKNTTKSNIRVNKNTRNHTHSRVNTNQSENMQTEKKLSEVRRHNEQLERELELVKSKLKKAESELTLVEDKSKINIKYNGTQSQQSEQEASTSKIDKNILGSVNKKVEENEELEYEEEFDDQELTKVKESQAEEQIEKYKKDFQENDEEEEELYKKQEEKPKKSKNIAEKSQKKKEKKSALKGQTAYKPNKKMLAQIKQLLTYRMKSQRYPFNDIKSDIQSAQTSTFTYSDLCNMFVNQPFYLTAEYTKAFLAYCFESDKVKPDQSINNAALIGKLRKVIDDFQLMEENEQKEMIIRIAEMTSTYPRELQVAFENIKNGEETVARKNLIEMFKKLELEDKYIDLIIAQLSLCSDDLQHLNFHGFFQRFYIQDENEEYLDNNAIEQQGQESEQSHKHSSRVKKQPQKSNNRSMGNDQPGEQI